VGERDLEELPGVARADEIEDFDVGSVWTGECYVFGF